MTEAVTITPGNRVINGRQVPEVGTWAIDPSHASFEFVARHLMAKVRGRFPDLSGEAHITEVPEESSLKIEIDASTIDTRDTDRDVHLRSSDFFRVEDHPTISFRSTAVQPGEGESKWKVDGELTIKGVTLWGAETGSWPLSCEFADGRPGTVTVPLPTAEVTWCCRSWPT
jgi:hypothetical protein